MFIMSIADSGWWPSSVCGFLQKCGLAGTDDVFSGGSWDVVLYSYFQNFIEVGVEQSPKVEGKVTIQIFKAGRRSIQWAQKLEERFLRFQKVWDEEQPR